MLQIIGAAYMASYRTRFRTQNCLSEGATSYDVVRLAAPLLATLRSLDALLRAVDPALEGAREPPSLFVGGVSAFRIVTLRVTPDPVRLAGGGSEEVGGEAFFFRGALEVRMLSSSDEYSGPFLTPFTVP